MKQQFIEQIKVLLLAIAICSIVIILGRIAQRSILEYNSYKYDTYEVTVYDSSSIEEARKIAVQTFKFRGHEEPIFVNYICNKSNIDTVDCTFNLEEK